MPPVWLRPSCVSPRLRFLFDNAPPADPNKVINVTCGGPHVENVSAGTKKPAEYGQRFVFVSISYIHGLGGVALTIMYSAFTSSARYGNTGFVTH